MEKIKGETVKWKARNTNDGDDETGTGKGKDKVRTDSSRGRKCGKR